MGKKKANKSNIDAARVCQDLSGVAMFLNLTIMAELAQSDRFPIIHGLQFDSEDVECIIG